MFGSHLSRCFENEISPGKILKDKGKSLELRIRCNGRCVVNVICFLIGRTNDNCPISFDDVFQFYFDLLACLVLVVTLLFDDLMYCAYDNVFNIWCDFGPLYGGKLSYYQFLRDWSFLHYFIINLTLSCYLSVKLKWSG
jgi:hypothetical protein